MFTIFGQLQSIRDEVDRLSLSFGNLFYKKYSGAITEPIIKYELLINQYRFDMEISSLIAPISSLYISLDNSALERDFLSYFLLKRLPLSSKDCGHYLGKFRG